MASTWPVSPYVQRARCRRRAPKTPSSSSNDRLNMSTPNRSRRPLQSLRTPVPEVEYDFRRHDNETDELEDHIIMAVDKVYGGKMGCAYYTARFEALCCMQDIEQAGPEVFEALIQDIDPTIVLFSARFEDAQNDCASLQSVSLAESDTSGTPLAYQSIRRPALDFEHRNAVNKIMNLNLVTATEQLRFLIPGENMTISEDQHMEELGFVDQQGKLLTASCTFDFDNKLGIGCVGALLSCLQRKRASEYLQHDVQAQAAYRISRLEMFSLKDTMLLNRDTLSSLQIIQSETHPNVANQGPNASGSKESLSIYSLFHNLAKTPQGKAKLRQIFLRPSLDVNIISRRHDFISVFVCPENQPICEQLSKSLRRVKNMQTTLSMLRKGIERGGQSFGTIRSGVWAAILEFCYHCIDIGNFLKEMNDYHLDDVKAAGHILDQSQLKRIGKMIHDVVDLDESLEQRRTVIKRGLDANLDRVKDAYEGMEETLAQVATEITNQMPRQINERLNVIFLPQLGFHVTVPLNEETGEPIWDGDGTWERRFRTGEFQYFKNDRMKDMDEHWGDLYAVICDTEIEMSHDLAQRVLESETWLIEASRYCGELDSLLALSHGAIQYRLSRPNFVNGNLINIRGGRHLLQEMTVASYVPNDTLISSDDDNLPSMMLITGPNYSGKSVYMKQVALIIYLAQIGSFVPAEAADLGICDKIFTRINTAETVSKIQSAFVIDMQQIAKALKACTSRSLVVIDEFGKGTDSCDGAGLASGVLKYLLDLQTESPKVLASTHFHEIFEQGDFDNYPNLMLANMEVSVEQPTSPTGNLNHVTYLYTLRRGRNSLAYGNQCAATNGIPSKVVDRAMMLAEMSVQGEDLIAACASLSQSELEELEDAEVICRMFLSLDFADSEDVQEQLDGMLSINATESDRKSERSM